ncbi:hypothetical protein [Anaerosporobacter sp.]|uniref:hypothetical protein n=1 Tax=Anaerosporobacter sp. TaxID=1872529 RepID=UPI00286FA51C|nr:hypothetical protein [Anaerosporobacter sp.]
MTENNLEVDEREEVIKKRRKKFKISIGVIAVVLLVIATLYTFVRSHYKLPNEIDDLNNNIDLPFKFNTPISEYDIDEEHIEDVEEGVIWVELNGQKYGFFSCLDEDSSTYKFAYYFTDMPKTSLFGFKVGDSMEKADKLLTEHGYSCEDVDSNYIIYKRGRVTILVYISWKKNGKNERHYITNREVEGYFIDLESTDEMQGYIY